MIDLDDVICNDGWLELVNTFLKANYTYKDVEGFYINELVPKELEMDFINWYETQQQYDYATLKDGVLNVIEKLNNNYEIYICSAFVFPYKPEISGEILKQKFNYLQTILPFLDRNKFIFCNNKAIINCEIKIDDSMKNLNNAETKILFTAYHNKNIETELLSKENIIRANNWFEIESILL